MKNDSTKKCKKMQQNMNYHPRREKNKLILSKNKKVLRKLVSLDDFENISAFFNQKLFLSEHLGVKKGVQFSTKTWYFELDLPKRDS